MALEDTRVAICAILGLSDRLQHGQSMKDIASARTPLILAAESMKGAPGLFMQDGHSCRERARPSDKGCCSAAWLRKMTCAFVPWKAKPLTPLALLFIIKFPGDTCAWVVNIDILI